MTKVYGMSTCPDCSYIFGQIEGSDSFEKLEIGSHVSVFKEFLMLRDNNPVFDECKKKGYAGIPCFVTEDGTVTLTPEEVGLKSRVQD